MIDESPIKYMYEQGDSKALEDLFTSNSIADFLNQADYIEDCT